MNDESPSPPDLSNIEIDLARSFLPDWAKGTDAPERPSRLAERYGDSDRAERPRGRKDDRGFREERRGGRPGGGKHPPRRDDRHKERRPERDVRPAPSLTGWNIQFVPDRHGVEGLAKQIKTAARAYPLFDLARLVLERQERYLVEFKRASDSASALFQLRADGSVWQSQDEAVAHAMAHHLDKFYRRERVAVEPPKGAYPFVAVCGMSGVLLGPPNYHDYQTKIRQLHAQRFPNVPFEVYKSRIRMERDEASIEKWREEQSAKDEFHPAETPEGAEPVKLDTLAAVEQHFRQHHAAAAIVSIRERVLVPGPAAMGASTPPARQLARHTLEDLQRFPLPLAHTLGQQLASKGLQIFKAHENITYVSVARPRYLDRDATPVSDGVRGILEYLEAHTAIPRAEQWKALVALRPPAAEGIGAAMAADLSWLLHEGYVIDFANGHLEAARRPKPRSADAQKAGRAEAPPSP